ncbi:hypothetical protein QAD02_019123 [Eretmocerus hayati]|uniref:Uncharacterized protein n=1 Tax=Eretmocerus hayati TaxID=131215 RepID=A0ACC2PIR4_9HYME|nr:hypothetical protein QAD02_019123 [Eretmocerus hayati]
MTDVHITLTCDQEDVANGPEQNPEEDRDWALGLNRVSLDLMGIWPHRDDTPRLASLRTLRVPMMIGNLIFATILPQTYALSLVYKDLPLALDNVATNIASVMATMKLILFWQNRHDLYALLKEAMDDWLVDKSTWERSVMKKQARRARIFTISGYACLLGCVANYTLLPYFGLTPRILNNITDPGMYDGRFFPMQVAFPFDSTKSPVFEVIYFFAMMGVFYDGVAFTVPDNLFGALVFHCSAQFEMLGVKMQQLLNGPLGFDINKQSLFETRLKQVVDTHIRLISFIQKVERSFNGIILSQIIGLSATGCCYGFQILDILDKEEESIPLIRFCICAGAAFTLMLQMLIYCLASEVFLEHVSFPCYTMC